MIFLNIFYLLIVTGGILLFAYGLQNKRNILTMLASILILTPIIILTVGPVFLGLAPALSLVILMIIPPIGSVQLE